MLRRASALVLASVVGVALVGCGAVNAQSPQSVLRAYGDALSKGRADEAYGYLSKEARQGVNLETYKATVGRNRDESAEIGKMLVRPTDDPYVTATVPLASGETVTLVLEDGRWKVDASALDFYSQATPRQAIVGFLRAFSRKRWDVLIKYTPDAHREGLTEDRLKDAWVEGKPEGTRIGELVEAIRQALPTATIEETGDRATMTYGSAGAVDFVREHGAWKIEDLR
jgi:hypothetical protein